MTEFMLRRDTPCEHRLVVGETITDTFLYGKCLYCSQDVTVKRGLYERGNGKAGDKWMYYMKRDGSDEKAR